MVTKTIALTSTTVTRTVQSNSAAFFDGHVNTPETKFFIVGSTIRSNACIA